MKPSIFMLCLTVMVFLSSCKTDPKNKNVASDTIQATSQKNDSPSKAQERDKADSLITETVAAHGGALYDKAHYKFGFRDKHYTFQNKNGGFIYTVTGQKDGNEIRDVLEKGILTRTVNGDTAELSPKDVVKYTEALNSVVYFATLPHKLQDAAVNSSYDGRTTIKGQDYDVITVTFDPEGGGNDHQDEFRYWINADTKTMDYLAYNYETDGGGVRFRSAYNPRNVGGIRFQDYVNYEAPIGTPLKELPELYESGDLKELSRIETEEVVELGE
ncbi:MAG TPA: DUF6503 family protein [Pricia sp.]|nr:DUF6503 family protein [Pricia sp.]